MRVIFLLCMAMSHVFADIQAGWSVVPDPDAVSPASIAGEDAPQQSPAPVMEGPAPEGAVAAMMAIDPKYFSGILVVTARGGTPVPKKWTVVARDSNDLGDLHKLTVADGQVIADVQSLNAYESFRQDVAINPQQVQVDSGAAFDIVEPIAAANQKIIGHVDYALTVSGADAAPIWTLNCFDLNGWFLGKVVMLATTGNVLSQSGFPNSPQ